MSLSPKDFNDLYLKYHVPKEDLFWSTYMGIEADSTKLGKAESEFSEYISSPQRLEEVREALAKGEWSESDVVILDGWKLFYECNVVENPEARKLQQKIIEQESQLFDKRKSLELKFRNQQGEEVVASTNVLSMNLTTEKSEEVRKSSHQALLNLEQWVLENGFIDIVKSRNAFARSCGFKNYFEMKLRKNERMSVEQLGDILEEFEILTRNRCMDTLARIEKEKGPGSTDGHNLKFYVSGDIEHDMDPYFPFAKSLEVWSRSFSRLGIRYRQASLTLDLFDRKGKYENGFMHGPQPSYYKDGVWQPARINFTSNATPSQQGSGREGLMTLFHEGGHAAHFSNVLQPSPCFSQEFPPTSMAYAETQSMFCDSLIGDGDWMHRYAKDLSGNSIPSELIREMQALNHPFQAFRERSILVVSVFERALYEMEEGRLQPQVITELARECEKKILGVECGPRPILAIPHLLSSDSACSYHGYLLANMAVYQTRAHFLKSLGYLCDNPEIGPALEKHYWSCGNRRTHVETIQSLTGEGLSGKALADFCNLSEEELWSLTQRQVAESEKRPSGSPKCELDAKIKVVHGAQTVASNASGMEDMWKQFEAWVNKTYFSGEM